MNVSELKNLFILHPGGTGGNHLANLISLIPEFEYRLDEFEGDYQQVLFNKYEMFVDPKFISKIQQTSPHGIKAHFLNNHGLSGLTKDSPDEIYKQKLLSNKKINILTGHWHCFDHADLSNFKNHAWIMQTFPKENSLAYKRIRVYDFWPQETYLYSEPFEFRRPSMESSNAFEFDTDIFVENNGAEYLRQFLNTNFEVHLPNIADEIHDRWMYGLKKVIELCSTKY